MSIKSLACCLALLFLVAISVESKKDLATKIEGTVVDINEARILNATLTFRTGDREYWTKTGPDGTYSIELKPGTYTMKAEHYGFCTLRRSGFVLQKDATVQFNLQMWVCPTDTEFILYTELEKIPHTHLRPLVLYAQKEMQGKQIRFRGATTDNDGTGHPRQYPAVLTFNLLTVRAEEILYDPSQHLVAATGKVFWQDENRSGTNPEVKIKLEGPKPKLSLGYSMH